MYLYICKLTHRNKYGRKSIKFNQMEANKIKSLKPSYDNLRIIGRVMFEAGGGNYWLHLAENAAVSCSNGANFMEMFWDWRNQAIRYLKNIDTFTVNLVSLQGKKVPFLYNQL